MVNLTNYLLLDLCKRKVLTYFMQQKLLLWLGSTSVTLTLLLYTYTTIYPGPTRAASAPESIISIWFLLVATELILKEYNRKYSDFSLVTRVG